MIKNTQQTKMCRQYYTDKAGDSVLLFEGQNWQNIHSTVSQWRHRLAAICRDRGILRKDTQRVRTVDPLSIFAFSTFCVCVLMCVLTCLAVAVGTVCPSCFKVLGLRREKVSRGTVVGKQQHQHREESHVYKHITSPLHNEGGLCISVYNNDKI